MAARIVVVGGGAGGLELAIRLARLTRPGGRAQVTLVDRHPAHIWKPRLHEIGVGLLSAPEEAASYAVQACRHQFVFVLGEARSLDPRTRQIQLAPVPYPARARVDGGGTGEGDALLPARTLTYDIAVLALGSSVNAFGTPGVERHCHTLDSAEGAGRLHGALLAKAEQVKAGVRKDVRVAIVGGGATGVELAAELRSAAHELPGLTSLIGPAQLHVTLAEMADHLLPGAPAHVSAYARRMLEGQGVALRLGAKVAGAGPDGLKLADGGSIAADVLVWATGMKARTLEGVEGWAAAGRNGRLAVDACLRVLDPQGRPWSGLYALGDLVAAPLPDGGAVPATAQAAHQQAGLLARSVARQLRGRAALAFRYRYKGVLVSLGGAAAVGDLPAGSDEDGLEITGWPAKLAYAALYQSHQAELHGPWRAGMLAAAGALRRSAYPRAKLPW